MGGICARMELTRDINITDLFSTLPLWESVARRKTACRERAYITPPRPGSPADRRPAAAPAHHRPAAAPGSALHSRRQSAPVAPAPPGPHAAGSTYWHKVRLKPKAWKE